MRKTLFWLSDEHWKRNEPHLPTDVRGVERVDDRRVISGTVHLLKKRLSLVRAFNRLKDLRRIASRYDRLARNYLDSDGASRPPAAVRMRKAEALALATTRSTS